MSLMNTLSKLFNKIQQYIKHKIQLYVKYIINQFLVYPRNVRLIQHLNINVIHHVSRQKMKTHILIDAAKFSNRTQHLLMIIKKSLGSLEIQKNILNLINSIKNSKIHTKATANTVHNDKRLIRFSQSLKQREDIYSYH